ncbi:MAG: 4Fe-4S dicluster domain-containing protein [Candidatus Omnitrophica bacterium]|nr:4Fe-4S dicluster domain-containing protein [Candidatus Omnitrophota bacterium]
MSEVYFSQAAEWSDFLSKLKKDFRVFLPEAKEEDYLYQECKDSVDFSFNSYRAVQPLKSFLSYPKEKISGGYSQPAAVFDVVPTVVAGLKNCDLHSLKIQDFVFQEGIASDPLYKSRRENTILISGDCTAFKEVCFCLALDVLPHPAEGFDLNLSPLSEGFLVEAGSKRGSELVRKYQQYFIKAKDSQISARDSKRENVIGELRDNLCSKNLPVKELLQKIVRRGYNSATWRNFCLDCVECGACNFICCTCHCFLLSENKEKDKYARLRVWDSCQYANFARVAGGANPLKRREQRLRNRFSKKFDFFVDNLGVPACEGCGRCIEACPGKIDIREVLKDLAKNA